MPLDHAIVLGGSIAGLLSAAAMSESFEKVTIVDRDELLTEGPTARLSRRGVPQGDQIHHLLSAGKDRIERLLPGLDDELLELGCEHHDDAADFAQYANGAWRTRVESDLVITCFQRPLFEWAIRRRVLAKSNVVTHKGLAIGLVASDEGGRVVGVRVRNAPAGQLSGDLVVDATGRGSKSSHWVEDLGHPRPEEMELRVYMGYATLLVQFPDGVLPEGVHGIMCGSSPEVPIGGAIRPCGNGQHIVVAYGVMKNYPPEDLDGVVEFLDRLPTPLLAQYVRKATPVSDVKPYRMPGNLRRLWERMDRRPEGLVVVGDAVASFNPKYGQGMTMAAIGATILGEAVAASGGELEGLAARVQSELAPWTDIAFGNAVGVDGAYPDAEYVNMEPVSAEARRSARAFADLQTEDPEVVVAARRAVLYMDPSPTRTEAIRGKLETWEREHRAVRPEAKDPSAVPPLAHLG